MIIKYLYNKGKRLGRVFQGEGISCENAGKRQIMQGFVGHVKSGFYPKCHRRPSKDLKQEVTLTKSVVVQKGLWIAVCRMG